MKPDLVELRAQGDQALFNFLKTDLDISLTKRTPVPNREATA